MQTLEYLNDEKVAKILSVHPMTIRRWRLSGLLGYVKLGPRKIGITEKHLDDFLARHERRAVAEAA